MTFSFSGQHYLAGLWQAGTGDAMQSENPVTRQIIWEGKHATENDIEQAFQAARHAATHWAITSPEYRTKILHAFAAQVEKRRAQLAELISLETGKPLWESLTEVSAVVGKINLSIQACRERNAEKKTVNPDATACLRYKPQGVVAVLGAFNFPAHLSNGHIVPALLAGNTVIYKPSELTPAVAELIMHCWAESGVPAGVINCLQGSGQVGRSLLDKAVDGVFFTGSYQTGKRIHQQFAGRPEVILALEMGGNNPLVVDEVSDLDAAVYHTILSTMITAGQRCTCARRLLIQNNAAGDRFLQHFILACQKLRVGPYTMQPEPFMGSVISTQQALSHLQAQQTLLQKGGEALLKMTQLQENSALLSPGIIDMSSVNAPADEEIFAPLVQVYRYDHFDDAIRMANQTRYGLAAGLLSDSAQKYQQFYQQVKAGLINWNKPTTGAASSLPFGGVACSGNHRPSAYFAADYCAYPIASMESTHLTQPAQLLPGISLE